MTKDAPIGRSVKTRAPRIHGAMKAKPHRDSRRPSVSIISETPSYQHRSSRRGWRPAARAYRAPPYDDLVAAECRLQRLHEVAQPRVHVQTRVREHVGLQLFDRRVRLEEVGHVGFVVD